jgi:8-oxo-dGTP pyrophosphatase MutT (NUDIX family)
MPLNIESEPTTHDPGGHVRVCHPQPETLSATSVEQSPEYVRVSRCVLWYQDSSGDIYIALSRRKDTSHNDPGKYEFPGGKPEKHENLIIAGVRETDEELNVRPTPITSTFSKELSYAMIDVPEQRTYQGYGFVCEPLTDEQRNNMKCKDGEASEFVWVNIAASELAKQMPIEDLTDMACLMIMKFREWLNDTGVIDEAHSAKKTHSH